jgi:hypothetical protein
LNLAWPIKYLPYRCLFFGQRAGKRFAMQRKNATALNYRQTYPQPEVEKGIIKIMPNIEKQSGKLLRRGRTGFEIGADVLRAQLKTMPPQPGVYRMINAEGSTLYIGKAKNLPKRVSS